MKKAGTYLFIDLETTGLNPLQDRICQIGLIKPDGSEFETLINPGVNIHPNSIEIHGITDEMVDDAPSFKDIAFDVINILEESEIFVAYNFQFDFQFLQNELFRAVQYHLKEEDFIFVDPYKIFRKMFPHSLTNAYFFYTGKQMESAHSAIHDIRATKEVLDKQKELYQDLFKQSLKEIEKFTIGDTTILGKWFGFEDGLCIFKQGKFRGEVVKLGHREYLSWIFGLEDTSLSEKRYISGFIGIS